MKCKGTIEAFIWVQFGQSKFMGNPVKLEPDEAYLYNMHTFPSCRGKSLAPLLRYEGYQALRGIGINRFYSVTERFNTASRKFKQKLHARHRRLCLYFELFGKYRRNWVLRNCV